MNAGYPAGELRTENARLPGPSVLSQYRRGVAPTPEPTASTEPDLVKLATGAADDPSLHAFVNAVKAAVADGSIWDQVANQPELDVLIAKHRH